MINDWFLIQHFNEREKEEKKNVSINGKTIQHQMRFNSIYCVKFSVIVLAVIFFLFALAFRTLMYNRMIYFSALLFRFSLSLEYFIVTIPFFTNLDWQVYNKFCAIQLCIHSSHSLSITIECKNAFFFI